MKNRKDDENHLLKGSWKGGLLVTAIVITWQLASQARLVSPVVLPPVSLIVERLYLLYTANYRLYYMPVNTLLTFQRVFAGYALSVVIAVPIGLILGQFRKLHLFFEPTIEILRVLPGVVLVPAFILLLGINSQMLVSFIAFGSLWPILINTVDGVRNMDPMLLDVAKSFRLSRLSVFRKVVFPASSPSIVSGMRVSLLLSLLLGIVIELTAGHNGIGWVTIYAEEGSDITTLYAEIFVVAVSGFLLNFAFVKIENRVLEWHKKWTNLNKR
ncbi:MAG: ABC transporter permease [Thaumarchaeota archaeon]|nr:ABC transporter permease [Nitrososphaerota archaeon]